tara:strand:- start:3638 stop:3862 length:225 start_codon:yes stop_codon:yes gene_type:complete
MTIMELSIAVVGILGAVGGVIKASNCKKVSVCKIIECERKDGEDKEASPQQSDFDKALELQDKSKLKSVVERKV